MPAVTPAGAPDTLVPSAVAAGDVAAPAAPVQRPGSTRCPTCGAAVDAAYCAACGEARLVAGRAPRDGPRAWLERLHASLQALASPPGRLTRDWNEGRRAPYLSPLSLLLWTNVAFFVVQGLSGVSILSWPLRIHLSNDILGLEVPLLAWRQAHGAPSEPAFAAAFAALESVHAKSLVVLMVPIFAALPFLAEGAHRQRFAAWFAFSAHFYTFALIALSALFPLVMLVLTALARANVRPSDDTIDVVVSTLEALMIGWYLYRALGTLTPRGPAARLLRAVLMVAAIAGILRLYHLAVFAVTVLAM